MNRDASGFRLVYIYDINLLKHKTRWRNQTLGVMGAEGVKTQWWGEKRVNLNQLVGRKEGEIDSK